MIFLAMPKNIFKRAIKLFGSLIIIIVLIIVGVTYYLENHKDGLLDFLEGSYSDHYYGDLTFDDVSINTFRNFPNITVTLKDFAITDSIADYDYGSLALEEVFFTMSLKNILDKKIQFKSLSINKGDLKLLNKKKHEKPFRKLFAKRIGDSLSPDKSSITWLFHKKASVLVENISVLLENQVKNKRINAFINTVESKYFFSDSIIKGTNKMSIQFKELGLNLENGTFFNGAQLSGDFPLTFDKTAQRITIPFFDLNIDDQTFRLRGAINTIDKGDFKIAIENAATDLKAISPLLSQNLQEKIKNYKISKPIYAYAEIEGGLEPGSIPLIKFNCDTEANDVFINENMHLKNLSFSGDFVNAIDKQVPITLDRKKDFQINVNHLIADFNNGSINIDRVQIKNEYDSSYTTKNLSWFPHMNSQILIENGHFMMADSIKNKRISGLINELNAKLNFDKNTISSSVQMNIQMNEMGLNLAKGTFFNDANLVGNMTPTFNKLTKHIEVPFFKLKIDDQLFKVKADINTNDSGSFSIVLENPRTKLKETTSLLSQNIQRKLKIYKASKPFYTHTTLDGGFKRGSNPVVFIKIETSNNDIAINDTILFNNVALSGDFVNRIYDDERRKHESKKNLKIEFNTLTADYKAIALNFDHATLLSTPKVKTYVDYQFTIKEPATILNSFFNSTEFIFTKGTLDFITSYKGEIEKANNLYYKSNSRLSLEQSNILHKTLNLEFPIDILEVEIIGTDGFLEKLIVPINEKDDILHFKGGIDNVTSLIFDGGDAAQTNLELFSENIIWNDFFAMFKAIERDKNKVHEQGETVLLNETINVIRQKFNPKFNLLIKSFRYDETLVHDLTSEVFLSDEHVYLEKTGFRYGEGEVSLKMDFDVSKTDQSLFDISLEFTDIDLHPFLREFDYFEISSLKNAANIAGIISLDTEMFGTIYEVNGLDTKSLKGYVNFDLRKLELSEFEPIQKIGDKIFKDKRFEDIRFADISQEIYIANRTIEIPRTEIQSTAFNLFVEGHFNYDDKTNIWLSIPLANLKKRDIVKIPDKEGFINSGKKVFIQVKKDEKGELEYKLHLSNKKLYKERGNLNQYRANHKNNRKVRNQNEKMKRVKNREIKKQEKS